MVVEVTNNNLGPFSKKERGKGIFETKPSLLQIIGDVFLHFKTFISLR